jgi:hypothetical protein
MELRARQFEKGMPTIQIAGMVVSVWMIEDSSRIDEASLEKDDMARDGHVFPFQAFCSKGFENGINASSVAIGFPDRPDRV